ncbi:MAG TPA: hypothetical protein VFB38_22720 [Chthonomonadaceae bacterium]|nr:hypothetical protein [Chthonomonadaceae bacterium]
MDARAAKARQERLERIVRERWGARDPEAQVTSVLRPDGKVDMTVVSRLFEGLGGLEREALFWPTFDPVPKSDLIYMTYCLLLTPEEAARHFAAPGDSD